MTELPREPEAFTELIVRWIRDRMRGPEIECTGPLEITIGDQTIEVRDLYRTVHHEDVSKDEAVRYVDQFINAVINAQRLSQMPLPLEMVRRRILPRIQAEKYLSDHDPAMIAHQPFVQETVILYVIELDEVSTAVTTEQLVRWRMSLEQLDRLARRNLARFQPNLELTVFHGEDGIAALFNTGDGYDASRLLLSELYPKVAPELGGDFLVAIPTRDVFIAFPTAPDQFVNRLHQRVRDDFRKLPYPITDALFYVTRDGVAAA